MMPLGITNNHKFHFSTRRTQLFDKTRNSSSHWDKHGTLRAFIGTLPISIQKNYKTIKQKPKRVPT